MNVKIITTDIFVRDAKRLIKKYHSLKNELVAFEESLSENPTQGTLITENVYKIRLAVKSKGKGKSGGLRIITFLHLLKEEDGQIQAYLLSIYDKSEFENLPDHQIQKMVTSIKSEFEAKIINQEEIKEDPENNEDSGVN
jgi:hypothetical protein